MQLDTQRALFTSADLAWPVFACPYRKQGPDESPPLRAALGRHPRRRRRGRRDRRRSDRRVSTPETQDVPRAPRSVDLRRYTASRADRSPHAHDLLLGPAARHAAARPAAPAGGHRLPGAGQRAPDARDRRHDRSRSRRLERDRLRDARPDRDGRDGRAADVRRRPGHLGRATAAGRRIPTRWRKAAEDRIKAGSDWVKVYGSRGSFDSVDTTQTLTFDEMKAIVDAAHAQDTRSRSIRTGHRA